MITLVGIAALSLTMQVFDDPIQDGISRNWQGTSYVTVTSNVVNDNNSAAEAKRDCDRELSRTVNRMNGRATILERHKNCYLVKSSDGSSGHYEAKIWFAGK